MPEEAVVTPTAPETDQSEVNLSDYRKARSEGKEVPETPAATPETDAAKTAPAPEAGKTQESEESEEEAGTSTKPKGGFQRKIDKLTKEKGELERTVGDLQSRLQTLEQKKPEVQQTSKAEGDPEPKEDDFKDYKEFAKALSRWVTRQELKANEETQAKSRREQAENDAKSQTKQQFDRYLGEMRSVKDAKADFDQAFADVQFPDYIHNRLVRMEKGAEIAYELAKNKQALGKILELNAEALRRGDNDFTEAYWEFGAFVRSLNKTSPVTNEKPVSQAPAPITPVGAGAGPTEIDLDKLDSVAEYRRLKAAGKIR